MNTLASFLPQHLQQNTLFAELDSALKSIIVACVQINRKIRLGTLFNVLSIAGIDNIQDEDQKKPDVIANEILVETLKQNPNAAGLTSEEEDAFVPADENGGYLVLFGPLDGSFSIDTNISVGTTFSILNEPTGHLSTESFLQKGNSQVGSGYVLYSPQIQLAFTLKHGVFIFTPNEYGEFVLTQEDPQVPASTREFVISMPNQRHWFLPMQRYIAELLEGNAGVRDKNHNMRWVASMVAEAHHVPVRDGVSIYPQDRRDPAKPGRLRLMYEANPVSLILKQAGGVSSNALEIMLDTQPIGLHQRVVVAMGSHEEVEYIDKLHLG